MQPTINNDPDHFGCYTDHAHDIATVGNCTMCGSGDADVVGHVLPDVERVWATDPVEAARKVVNEQTAAIFDGVLLDLFTAQYIVQVADRLGAEALAKLRSMPLAKAGQVCFKLAEGSRS